MTTTSTLTDSISSLGSASPSRAPSISRMYKQASQLFLTRQLADAWTVLSPLVNPQPIQNGSSDGESRDYEPRQIATASKSARVKVWGLWIALVHEVLLLGDTEGVIVMQAVEEQRGEGKSGAKRWKELARRVQEGGIWEDVVRVGYGGVEGAVDGEVVGNLATLLLSHAPTQTLTQSRLETYLSSTSSAAGPSPAQLASRLEDSSSSSTTTNGHPTNGHDTNGYTNGHSNAHPTQNGTSTPADLSTRLKLLEIYTLHVLPRNSEWDYARDFIAMSELLDEDRREAFLAALGGLREEHELAGKRENELSKRRELEAGEQERRRVEEQRKKEDEEANRKMAGEWGLRRDAGASASAGKEEQTSKQNGSAGQPPSFASSAAHSSKSNKSVSRTSASTSTSTSTSSSSAPSSASSKKPVPASSNAAKRARPTPPNASFLTRAQHTLLALQRVLLQAGTSMWHNPLVVLRFLLFLVAVMAAMGRRDVRDRLGRAWEKVKGTVGMGVRTSYL